ncbi:hypothetical protein LV75_000623 [Actinokineospora diospyrosa]|uniref:Uncharacterized protein n=1 Tax=Actinokineospora diospyrosa TaxID=103728 RepID=A0ABT1I680_9PSEU|nr:hypothetical protein [Actinokineospora diospyrosa]
MTAVGVGVGVGVLVGALGVGVPRGRAHALRGASPWWEARWGEARRGEQDRIALSSPRYTAYRKAPTRRGERAGGLWTTRKRGELLRGKDTRPGGEDSGRAAAGGGATAMGSAAWVLALVGALGIEVPRGRAPRGEALQGNAARGGAQWEEQDQTALSSPRYTAYRQPPTKEGERAGRLWTTRGRGNVGRGKDTRPSGEDGGRAAAGVGMTAVGVGVSVAAPRGRAPRVDALQGNGRWCEARWGEQDQIALSSPRYTAYRRAPTKEGGRGGGLWTTREGGDVGRGKDTRSGGACSEQSTDRTGRVWGVVGTTPGWWVG